MYLGTPNFIKFHILVSMMLENVKMVLLEHHLP